MESLYSPTCGSHQFTLLLNSNLIKQQVPRLHFPPASCSYSKFSLFTTALTLQEMNCHKKIINALYYRAGSWSGNNPLVSQVSVIMGLQTALFKKSTSVRTFLYPHLRLLHSNFNRIIFCPSIFSNFYSLGWYQLKCLKRWLFQPIKQN